MSEWQPDPPGSVYRPGHDLAPDFTRDRAVGMRGESAVADIIASLGTDRVEVKTDLRAIDTGNLFVEFESTNKAGEWKQSGISITDAEVMVFVLGPPESGLAYVIKTELLRQACAALKGDKWIGEQPRGTCKARGYKLPIGNLIAAVRHRSAA